MFKFIENAILKFTSWRKSKDIERCNDYIKDMFNNTECWKDYPTNLGVITGLTPLDAYDSLIKEGFETTLADIYSYFTYLRRISYIDRVGVVTLDRIPVYIKR